ncbi:hypothetical protein lbkm_1308 [Lachnospiraceae bacterium KM106-2]|nr:hypothetical protein lbkm_1308 [Lachnospiraceae bacterium KM106-2]
MSVWFDEYSIKPGEHIYDCIKSGMEEAPIILFWISKEFLSSDWCQEEMRLALEKKMNKFYLIDDDVNKSDLPKEIFDYKYINIKRLDSIESIASKILNCLE